jgi:hypothetical protein
MLMENNSAFHIILHSSIHSILGILGKKATLFSNKMLIKHQNDVPSKFEKEN